MLNVWLQLSFGQHAMRMGHTIVCGLSGRNIILDITSQTSQFSEK